MFILTTLAITGLAFGAWEKIQQNRNYKPKKIKKSIAIVKKEVNHTITYKLKETTKYQNISLIALGLTGVGAIFYAPITLLAVPLLTYNFFKLFETSYEIIIKEKKIMLGIFEFISIAALLPMGYYFISAFAFFIHFTIIKLILKTKKDANIDFSQIFTSLPKKVWVLKGSIELEIELNKIQTNDILVIHSGEIIATDGIVIGGEGTVDQSILTGESTAVEKKLKDEAFAQCQ